MNYYLEKVYKFKFNFTVPWRAYSIEGLNQMIKREPLQFNSNVKISEESKDFLNHCLQYDEGKLFFN